MANEDEIEQCLRRIARDLFTKGEVTVNTVRTAVESELDLESGFFKNDAWKERSKELIHDTINEEEASPEKPKPKVKAKAKPAAKAGTKRKSDSDRPDAEKRRKKSQKVEMEPIDDLSTPPADVEDEESGVKPTPKRSKKPTKQVAKLVESEDDEGSFVEGKHEMNDKTAAEAEAEESELSDVPDRINKDAPKSNGANSAPADDHESDLSSLIDEPPARKKRQKKTSTSEPKSKSKSAGKGVKATKSKAGKEISPDEEEIKRLQGWLVKCGLRKLWHKELAPYDDSKAKIKHLKKMLEDVGMTGRYSVEKARGIKEARELAAEIEAAQEFNDLYGQDGRQDGDEDEDDKDEKHSGNEEKKGGDLPKRRRPKGLVDFGDSGDDGSD